mmetsp:Transcript_31575/g.65966  ORF Transcript_31575/g.65966 Transcript_31575/m.65966 type:complete len:88 (-) Transcript_31575:25-288(-)
MKGDGLRSVFHTSDKGGDLSDQNEPYGQPVIVLTTEGGSAIDKMRTKPTFPLQLRRKHPYMRERRANGSGGLTISSVRIFENTNDIG